MVVSVLQEWLLRNGSSQFAQQELAGFATVELPREIPESASNEYWLCNNNRFGILVSEDGWDIRTGAESLANRKSKVNGSRKRLLSFEELDRLCGWLATHWDAIAFGKDPRPPVLRDKGVAACRAYERARITASPEELADLQLWWTKHAIRAADPDLPNIFLERQVDDLVISWDASPSGNHSFMIPYGTEITSVRFAVPHLRRLLGSRKNDFTISPKRKKQVFGVDPDAGYRILRSTFQNMTKEWLRDHQFSNENASEMALAGTARHPVVGLLRSAQSSKISLSDIESIWGKLQPNTGNRFQHLRALAKGMNAQIDLREPWQSGYHLARLVRAELSIPETGYFDIEAAVQKLGVDVQDASFADESILAACVGSPQFAPLIVVNTRCDDANGPSGRRITLAHELCHLLFDRSRMQSFARFEGGAAETDRLIEMRANAFAVELLAPIRSFIRPDGNLMTDEEAEKLSVELQVSIVAVRRHVQNHR